MRPTPVRRTAEVLASAIRGPWIQAGRPTSDVVFFNAALQEPFAIGREALGEALYWFYHVAFDAIAIPRNMVIGEGKAVYEGTIVGTHIGEFAGIPATENQREPLHVK